MNIKKFLQILILIITSFILISCDKEYNEIVIDNIIEEVEEIVDARVETPTGRSFKLDVSYANIPGVKHSDFDELHAVIGKLNNLSYVNLGKDTNGNGLTPADIYILNNDYPEIKFDYTFNIYGKEVTLDDEVLDFNHILMDDNGATVVDLMKVLRNPLYLDMDFTGVDNEVLAKLREDYPKVDIQWRIWIGDNYSIRTDAERFVASEPAVEVLTGNALDPLKYCTKIKYLDIGHNEIDNISFISTLTELESAVICLNSWSDLSPISNCTKLNYLEINDTNCNDLSPLSTLTNLEHLNVCNLGVVTGWSSIKNLTKLERLWIGQNTYIDDNTLLELKSALPNTTINIDSESSDLGAWRWIPNTDIRVERYERLFDEMGYYMSPSNQSYYYHDDKYFPESYNGPITKWPEINNDVK